MMPATAPLVYTSPSESQTRRTSALSSALAPIAELLGDERVVEVMGNADGVVWVDRLGEGLSRTAVRVSPSEVERMLRLVAAEMACELNAQTPSLSAKLPPPWGARLQGAIPPIVDAPVFALRKPAVLVFSLDDYVDKRIVTADQREALTRAVHARDNILIGGGTGSGIIPALEYLFHRVEHQFDGRPTLMVVDEAWLFLGHPVFASRLQAWLKTLRKKNVYVVFATQEVADATSKPELLSTILSACHTKIFLPDEEALTPAMAAAYESVGLTTAEIEILAKAQKKRDYYYRSVKGRRLFQLGLGPGAFVFVGASTEADQRFLDEMISTRPPGEYAAALLDRRGILGRQRSVPRGRSRPRPASYASRFAPPRRIASCSTSYATAWSPRSSALQKTTRSRSWTLCRHATRPRAVRP